MKNLLPIFLLILLLNTGCSEFSYEQQQLLDKKWYCGKGCSIEFKNDGKEIINFEYKKTEYDFEFLLENEIKVITNAESLKSYEMAFEIKDSFLLLFYKNPQLQKLDTSYYHLNPRYEFWQIIEIYKYGKITNQLKPLPFAIFEF